MSEPHHRPASDYGDTGVVGHFRGPFTGGPPPEALEVETPDIDRFGLTELRRMVVILAVLVWFPLRRLARRAVRPRHGSWAAAGSDGLVDAFIVLGPTFVKLGQLMASSPGVFPSVLSDAATRCLDEVPPFPGSAAREAIRRDLGHAPSQVFRSFDESPVSAASIGQVHVCTLPDGREAVIKLQRPDIRRLMTTDLRIMYRLAVILDRRTKLGRNANVVGVIEDLHANTFMELNPVLEAWRQHRFREALDTFGDNEGVTAPEVFWEFCGPHMMEQYSGGAGAPRELLLLMKQLLYLERYAKELAPGWAMLRDPVLVRNILTETR